MYINSLKRFVFVAILSSFALTGCNSLKSIEPYSTGLKVDPTKGYVYGKFTMDRNNSSNLANNWLVINNMETNEPLLIPFVEDEGTFVLPIPAGNYQVKELIHTPAGPLALASSKYDVKHLPLPADLLFLKSPFSVSPNKAYYIGDYVSLSETKMDAGFFVIKAKYYYGLQSFEYKFVETTHELEQKYPEFINVDKIGAYGE